MGKSQMHALRVDFDRSLRLEFHNGSQNGKPYFEKYLIRVNDNEA
jgi:hypothetical protein